MSGWEGGNGTEAECKKDAGRGPAMGGGLAGLLEEQQGSTVAAEE